MAAASRSCHQDHRPPVQESRRAPHLGLQEVGYLQVEKLPWAGQEPPMSWRAMECADGPPAHRCPY
jgi:hypothetical protein